MAADLMVDLMVDLIALLLLAGGLRLLSGRKTVYRTGAKLRLVKEKSRAAEAFVQSRVSALGQKRQKRQMDLEIYEAISYLRNITVLGRGQKLSADSVLEELSRRPGALQPIYGRSLQLLRLNRREEAGSYFAEAVGTDMGRDFGRLLLQWDEIGPKELLETLLSHQKSIKELRATAQKRRNETVSDVLYLPVVINVMLVFINFIYIAYFMDQREMLSMFL